MKIDSIDLAILETLQKRGKISNVHLADKIGLSPGPTLERVRKLESSGIIDSYHAKVNPEKIGLGFKALVNLTLTRQKESFISDFRDQINQIDEVVACYQLTGNYDYQLTVVVKDIPSFENLIAEKLSKIEEIGSMHTTVVLSEVKSNPVLPLNYKQDKLSIKL